MGTAGLATAGGETVSADCQNDVTCNTGGKELFVVGANGIDTSGAVSAVNGFEEGANG